MSVPGGQQGEGADDLFYQYGVGGVVIFRRHLSVLPRIYLEVQSHDESNQEGREMKNTVKVERAIKDIEQRLNPLFN